jgi:hypothetical protein
MNHETWNSVEIGRLLMSVYGYLPMFPRGSLQEQTRQDLRRVVERLQRTATERGCPTCGSSFFTFEEASEP